jgi:hypothetical protein
VCITCAMSTPRDFTDENPKIVRKQVTLSSDATALGQKLADERTRGNFSLMLDTLILNEAQRHGISVPSKPQAEEKAA